MKDKGTHVRTKDTTKRREIRTPDCRPKAREWEGPPLRWPPVEATSRHIVSTPLGSSGWLKSLLKGATGLAGAVTGQSLEVPPAANAVPWETPKLYFTVREPFPSRISQAEFVFGEIGARSPLTIRSLMPENGVLFSDGIEADFIEFNSGAVATITLAETRGHLVVP